MHVATHDWNSFAGVAGLSWGQASAHWSHTPAFGACMNAIRSGLHCPSAAHPQHVSHWGSLCVPGVPGEQLPPDPVDALVVAALEADTVVLEADTPVLALEVETPEVELVVPVAEKPVEADPNAPVEVDPNAPVEAGPNAPVEAGPNAPVETLLPKKPVSPFPPKPDGSAGVGPHADATRPPRETTPIPSPIIHSRSMSALRDHAGGGARSIEQSPYCPPQPCVQK